MQPRATFHLHVIRYSLRKCMGVTWLHVFVVCSVIVMHSSITYFKKEGRLKDNLNK